MDWPSKNVPRGGFLQPARCTYNPETHQFLKQLLQESKMTMTQNKKNNYFLRNGEPFPTQTRSHSHIPQISIRPGSSKKRSRETIMNSGVYEREQFFPKPMLFDREKEKEKLQNQMAYNADIVVHQKKVIEKKICQDNKEEINRFDQLLQEIRDREEWLKEMESMGQGEKYRQIIELQIQEKVREMNRMKCSN